MPKDSKGGPVAPYRKLLLDSSWLLSSVFKVLHDFYDFHGFRRMDA